MPFLSFCCSYNARLVDIMMFAVCVCVCIHESPVSPLDPPTGIYAVVPAEPAQVLISGLILCE